MAKEFKRVCRKCSAAWYVTKQQAAEKPPNGMLRAGADMMAIGSGGLAGGFKAGVEAQRSRVESYGRCPACGSTSFTQTKDYGLAAKMQEVAAVSKPVGGGHRPGSLPPGYSLSQVVRMIREYRDEQYRAGRKLGLAQAKAEVEARLWAEHDQQSAAEEAEQGRLVTDFLKGRDGSDASSPADDPIETLRRLAALRDEGVISEEEFETKKRELLDAI